MNYKFFKKSPLVFIILLNYNGESDTLECLESLRLSDYSNYKIILVDNGSDDADAFLEKIRKDFSNVKTIALETNTGFSGGNNAGIRYALKESADYVCLLNNDTTVAPDFLSRLVEAGESDKAIGIVGAKIYFSGSNRIWYNGATFSWFGGGNHRDEHTGDKIRPTDYVTGCVLLIKAGVVNHIGLLYEPFFLYYEDVDWSLRVRKAGYKLAIANASHVWHKVSQTTKKLGNPRIQYYHYRNALLLSQRNAPRLLLSGIYIWSFFQYIKQCVYLCLPSKRPVARAIMKGIRDFYAGTFGIYHDYHRH